MESICGKQARLIDAATLAARIAGYREILIDFGTGDGRYVRTIARECPSSFAIGIDACRENLRSLSRDAPPNALFVIANALALPRELCGLATRITINFPWGSLLVALLERDPALRDGLVMLARPGATLEIRLNQGALAEAGGTLAARAMQIQEVLRIWGFDNRESAMLDTDALRRCPTTWARRLAYGRDPCGWSLTATWPPRCASNARSVYPAQSGRGLIAPS
ncbi:MAG: class I SAM-dependent methyltransferase [Thermomicrobia bacterium]|nr:class I SAM-dependent methyltransferase [Thermomicrobia bacterium]MCA1722972.1 class I SAM-dependent methyltransferase [Thermomicrobia bacterium]